MKCEYCDQEHDRRRFCSNQCKTEYHKAVKRKNNEERHKNNPKLCAGCGNQYIPYRDDQTWCSDSCKTNDYAKSQRDARTEARSKVIRICSVCEKEFTPKRTLKEKYCSKRCRCLFPKKIYKALQTCYTYFGEKKRDHANKLLGYSPRQLQDHIKNHPNWERVKDSEWHLDHIFPIIAFLEHGIKDIAVICRLDNLQPLSGTKNSSKNGSYDEKAFLDWLNSG